MARKRRRPQKPGGRNWDNPLYKAWRKAALARDGYKCKRCGSRTRLQVHHIRRWADFPTLRYNLANSITICAKCHKLFTGSEQAWAAYCMHLVMGSEDGND